MHARSSGRGREIPWYDARTPEADLIVYSGHAGLGWNVRTLMTKGTFRAGKYAVWSVNGCDTFAYVDRTLATRRAKLNPDDPSGTKYLDVVSNVMAGTFATGPHTTLTLIDAMIGAKKTYRDIFFDVDAEQVIAVTGEEDNVFQPKAAPQTSDAPPYPPTILPPESYTARGSAADGAYLDVAGNEHPAAKRRRHFTSIEEMIERLREKPSFGGFTPAALRDYCTWGLLPCVDPPGRWAGRVLHVTSGNRSRATARTRRGTSSTSRRCA